MSEQANALTREEQEFAAEHYGLIDLHLKVNHLSSDQWWDVLVFGYLAAVRCWFRTPQVRKWAFPTIAKVKMRSAMCDQLTYENRQKRQGHVVSLDACLEAGSRLYDLLPDSSGADEQVIFEMLVCSMASGLSGTEKAVLRLSTEGCSSTQTRTPARLKQPSMRPRRAGRRRWPQPV